MELLQSWLSSLTHYILTFLKFPFFRVKAEPKSHLLFLPPEILLQILNYLDYRALIDTRQVYATHLRIFEAKFYVDLQGAIWNVELQTILG